ncbi:hypothetical protein KX729_22200 [Rhizobium sp. XQZ8]|uniref:sacsin N-terminal ATP-binding-like domain-containing protein n=1 Tax=Rhizobium populisoli TaxID=2859785 RepID=UPI001CA4B60A|nr:hypothetical protein [Rhizobium populisoli]MBW6424180.1 hypothetical protein [Rhizobium populisoli]
MTDTFQDWLGNLQAKRQRWVDASHENDFDRGIWNATVDKYADPSHFIFELLQNAEDAAASWVRFELQPDRIIFEHDGRPFNRYDIEGITGIGNTTKLDDGHKIGCFGIGFKSVYVVTERPEVHSTIEGCPLAFAIDKLVVPRLIGSNHVEPTTQIVLPLRADRAALAIDRARDGLIASGARSLLFLRHIQQLEWIDGERRGTAKVVDSGGSIRSIESTMPDGRPKLDRYLVLARGVEHEVNRKQYEVKAAFKLNGSGDLVAEEAPTRLMVFFETEELTGLHFTIHGPFQLTDNRGNIKRDDPWNTELVDAIANMVADALPDLRERGMLKRGVLDLLPNAVDELPPTFAPMLATITKKFAEEDLIPVHGGGFTKIRNAIRGPADLRDLLGEMGLAEFCNRANRRWIVVALRNSRADHFISTLKIEDFSPADFFASFRHVFGAQTLFAESDKLWRSCGLKWFGQRSDEQVQLFYLALDAAQKAQRPSISISDISFVRLEDGRYYSPRHAVFAPPDSDLESEVDQGELYLVKKSLIRLGRGRGKEVEQFLRRVGVRDIDERAFLNAILRTRYRDESPRPNREQHLQHMRRFLRWWKETKDIGLFNGLSFIRAGVEAGYYKPHGVYFGSPYQDSPLSKVYDGTIADRNRAALWEGYRSLSRIDLMAFLEACGVERQLMVLSSRISYGHPNFSYLRHNWGGARHTGTGVDVDYRIDQLAALLKRRDPQISKLVWEASRQGGATAMVARYSPNQQYAAHKAPSSMGHILREVPWIPTKDGSLRKPNEITSVDLAKGFSVGGNEDWLRAIGFGEQERLRSEHGKARREAGELIGLAPELIDRLNGLSPEALATLSADMMRTIDSGMLEPVEFPVRETGNASRRTERLSARAKAAPAKTYEVRARSVRTSNAESHKVARTYLEDQYTNPLEEMVCQGCHDKMPFNRPDGSPYFEAVECLDSLPQEQPENHLALCPTCSAKWRHANPITDAKLREKIAAAEAPEISVELAGESVRLRFTQVHLNDLRTIGDILSLTSRSR